MAIRLVSQEKVSFILAIALLCCCSQTQSNSNGESNGSSDLEKSDSNFGPSRKDSTNYEIEFMINQIELLNPQSLLQKELEHIRREVLKS